MFKEEQLITECTVTENRGTPGATYISKLQTVIDVAYCPVCGRKLHKQYNTRTRYN